MLTPFTTVEQWHLGQARELLGGRFQCLRCGCEFKPEEPRLGLDSEKGKMPLFQMTGTRLAFNLPSTQLPQYRESDFKWGSVTDKPLGGRPRGVGPIVL